MKNRIDMAAFVAIVALAFAIAGCGDGKADKGGTDGKSGEAAEKQGAGENALSKLFGGALAKNNAEEADDDDDEDEDEEDEIAAREARMEAEMAKKTAEKAKKAQPKPDPVQEFLSKPPVKVETKTKTVTLPGGEKMEMVWCPPGTFVMGSPESEDGRARREHQIKVTLTKGFWIGKYEVTQRQYRSVIGKNPSLAKFQDDDLPVGIITWPLAEAFCQKIGARLPTSAEWEYACRAGTRTAYPWGDSCNGKEANCDGTSPCGTKEEGPNLEHPVKGGSYPPNAWGICDMNGNMMEWCSDLDESYDKDVKELVDPKGPAESRFNDRVIRGGSFYSGAKGCRSAWINSESPRFLTGDFGLRIVMDE